MTYFRGPLDSTFSFQRNIIWKTLLIFSSFNSPYEVLFIDLIDTDGEIRGPKCPVPQSQPSQEVT